MPRHTDAAGVTRPRLAPQHRQAAELARQYGRPVIPATAADLRPDAPAGAYALAGAPAVDLVPCLEERAPGLLVVRMRPIDALGWVA